MKVSRFRIQAAALVFILLPAAVGVVAIRASATCERFVRTYVTKPVRNRVSKTPAEAWAKWRIGHPNRKPNSSLHRPKYVMNRQEAGNKLEFACSVPLIDLTADELVPPDEIPPPMVDFQPMEATQITFPADVPPEVAEITPQDSFPPLAPFVPPILGSLPTIASGAPGTPGVPVPAPTAEPASLMLVGTGLAAACLMLAARIRTEKAQFSVNPNQEV